MQSRNGSVPAYSSYIKHKAYLVLNQRLLSLFFRQVHVLGSGVRDPVPAAADGGTLQEVLQHVRLAGGLHRGAAGAAHRRREDAGAPTPGALPRLGPRQRGGCRAGRPLV